MLEFIKAKNKDVSEDIINSIVDPATAHIDHSSLSKGKGLVLGAEAITRLRNSEPKPLKNISILLEPTIFGTAMSGRVPENLRNQVETVCNFNIVPVIVDSKHEPRFTECEDYELKQDLQFLGDQEHLGICTEEVHEDDKIA